MLIAALLVASIVGFLTSHYPSRILGNPATYERAAAEADALAISIKASGVTGRVFVEETAATNWPHLFTTTLPAHGVETITGLLAESSLTIRTTFPALRSISRSLTWGKFYQPHEDDIGRNLRHLADQGVELIVLSEEQSIAVLDAYLAAHPGGILRSRGVFLDRFHGYGLSPHRPLLSTPAFEPTLLIDLSGRSREQTLVDLWWYVLPHDVPFALPGISRSWPTEQELEPFTQVALRVQQIDDALVEKIASLGAREVFILQGNTDPLPSTLLSRAQTTGQRLWQFPRGAPRDLAAFIVGHPERYARQSTGITPIDVTPHSIRFEAEGPVIINRGYFPYWNTGDAPVTWLAPDRMLVFARGATTVTYAAPPLVNALEALAAAALCILLVRRVLQRRTAALPHRTTPERHRG